ncbi:YjbH domain-containing protein [Siccirubricoccus sp. G192]|uniref:YjbH domain-containing protein n=1 Tax=Siccirubricoccus sp. G192 TaxID=2849651 RepID=UPI002810E8E0|nr:YjbH domain-containing protein [Siccirubricoccus sp. G192]
MPATGGALGGVGLIEMRNARFRPDATLEAGAAFRRNGQAWFLSAQPLPFLETTFRLERDSAFDLKLRLWQENAWRPALAVGLQDAGSGGGRAGEYLVASKRFRSLDLSLGLGWGRLGRGGDLPNPLRRDWAPYPGSLFRSGEVALFGGLEWSLPALPTPLGPMEGLRAKLEWSGDSPGPSRNAASRVNLGLQWQPNPWLDAGLHLLGGTDLLLRLSLRTDAARQPEPPRPPLPMAPRPAPGTNPAGSDPAALKAALRRAGFDPLGFRLDGAEARIAVAGGPYANLAQVAGRVARAVQPHLPATVERLRLEWRRQGVTVARLVLLRQAMEAAAAGPGSAEEVLAATTLLPAENEAPRGPSLSWALEPRIALQLGNPRGVLRWQAGLATTLRIGLGGGVAVAGSLGQAVAGNLDGAPPSRSRLPHVRSDIALYSQAPLSVPTLYAERIWTPAPDLFARLTAGLLEPMFGGISGEVLWRPAGRGFALGLDLNWVAQRDYGPGFAPLGYTAATGHLSLHADLPVLNLYTLARAGRYLAGDWGGTLEVGRRFASGIEIGGFASLTNATGRYGEGNADRGFYLRLPLQFLGPATDARAIAVVRPGPRDAGQRLAVDNPLWEVAREGRAEALDRGFMGFLR